MNRIKSLAASALIALSLAACGGGGGGAGGAATDNSTNTTTDTVISGMASKGPIDGTVKIYALNADGSKGSLLKIEQTDPNNKGSYSANIGKYAGPVIIEVTGSYTDEATGNKLAIDDVAPMRAALSNASGTVTVAVTPLTELAVQKARTLTPSNINDGNKLVSDIFKIDIINTQPVAPENVTASTTDQSQKDYTLALATISQLSKNRLGEPLSDTLASVASSISYSGMTPQTVASFQKAVTDIKASDNFKDVSSMNLANVGTNTATYKIAITDPANMAADAIKGIQLEIVIPAGLTIRSNAASGETLSGIVTASTSISSAAPNISSKYTASSSVLAFGLITSTGIGPGELATITCDVLPGWTVPSAKAFSVRNIKAVDGTAATVSGVSMTVN